MVRAERDRTQRDMKVTLLLSTSGLDESAGTPESVQLLLVGVFGEASNCSDETCADSRSGRSRTKLRNRCPSGAELKVRIHSPPAKSRANHRFRVEGFLRAGLGVRIRLPPAVSHTNLPVATDIGSPHGNSAGSASAPRGGLRANGRVASQKPDRPSHGRLCGPTLTSL